jgi:hypothetical protein
MIADCRQPIQLGAPFLDGILRDAAGAWVTRNTKDFSRVLGLDILGY